MITEIESKEQLWKLVDRLSNEVYHDNLDYEKGIELLHSNAKQRDKLGNYKKLKNRMLIPISYRFTIHSTMGAIWA